MTKIDKRILDKFLEGVDLSNPQSIFTESGLFGQLKKSLAERILQAELEHHLEQERSTGEIKGDTSKGCAGISNVMTKQVGPGLAKPESTVER